MSQYFCNQWKAEVATATAAAQEENEKMSNKVRVFLFLLQIVWNLLLIARD